MYTDNVFWTSYFFRIRGEYLEANQTTYTLEIDDAKNVILKTWLDLQKNAWK